MGPRFEVVERFVFNEILHSTNIFMAGCRVWRLRLKNARYWESTGYFLHASRLRRNSWNSAESVWRDTKTHSTSTFTSWGFK